MRRAEGSKQIAEGYRSGVTLPGAPPEKVSWITPGPGFECVVGGVSTRGASSGGLAPRYPRLSRSQDSKLVANNHLLRSH